jgi:hypothetical protein
MGRAAGRPAAGPLETPGGFQGHAGFARCSSPRNPALPHRRRTIVVVTGRGSVAGLF